jgi:hypothetical protein
MFVLPVVAIAFAAAAAFLILKFAPFPLLARLLIVFGAFLAYEFSVIARNYGVAIMLMIVACILFPKRGERPLRLGLTLAIMANTSIHAAIASLVLAFVWALDVFDRPRRRAVLRGSSIAALVLVVVGVIIAVVSATPSPDIAFGAFYRSMNAGTLLRKILTDPGVSIAGSDYADIAAAGDLPWARLGIDRALMSRIVVDVALISIAWSLRKNWKCLLGMLAAIIGFSIVFRGVYTGALRHEGVLTFLLISLCWIAANEPGPEDASTRRRRLALGMLPLLATQSLTLIVLVRRPFVHPESSAKAFASFIATDPRYRNAILMGEPDYNLETMPYYVTNPVYMPRQHEFHYRVYFDQGPRRQQSLSLGQLVNIADSLTCQTGRVVLLAIAYEKVMKDTAGVMHIAYRPAEFTWSQEERTRLFTRGKHVASFLDAVEEDYYVFEIDPEKKAACHTPLS